MNHGDAAGVHVSLEGHAFGEEATQGCTLKTSKARDRILPALPRTLKFYSTSVALILALLGLLGLGSYIWGSDALKTLIPDHSPAAAFAFALAGLSLWIKCKETPARVLHKVAQFSAIMVAFLALLTISSY